MSERKKVAVDELNLVKMKFMEIGPLFLKEVPVKGLRCLHKQIGKDLGIDFSRVDRIIRDWLCHPLSEHYDEKALALREKIKVAGAMGQFMRQFKMCNPGQEFRQFAYSDTPRILEAMETRFEEGEMANVILRKEKEDLHKANSFAAAESARLQSENDRLLKKQAGSLNQLVNCDKRMMERVARIKVLEEEKLEVCEQRDQLILNQAKRNKQITELKLQKDDELRARRQVEAGNKHLEIRIREQAEQIQQVEETSAARFRNLEELQKQFDACRDGGSPAKKAEASFIKRWSPRFLPKAEKKEEPTPDSECPF
jgi:DNA repair exonuclease SbcCD ATPase subunit